MSGTNGSNGTTATHPRAEWITKRREEAARTGDTNMSQMHFARKGLLTEEMLFIAERERVSPELIRDEVAVGHMIIPANINHPELEPMCIGVASKCKINSNIGNSSVTSNVDEELKKLHTAVHFGADTVMDLSTGGDIPMIREKILRHSPVPIGTVPLYEALSRVKRVEDLNIDLYLEVIEEQAQQGVDYFTIHAGVLIQYVPLVAKRITGIVSRGGAILAQFSNGNQTVVGQLAMATIRNPQSLVAIGNSNYELSAKSALPAVGVPGTGGRGTVKGGAVEASTVDIATEFTNLIIYQRGYEANSKVVSAVDELSQTTIGLIH